MGLDVYLTRGGERLQWDHPISQKVNGFPFDRYEEKIPQYNNPDDKFSQSR